MSQRAEGLAVVAGLTCLALATTYPLLLGPGSHLPSDLGDPLLTAWTLAWDASRMPSGLAGLWDAPNFFPYRHTLAYSDHLLGIAFFTAPLQALTGNPVLVYNVAFLASVVLSGGGMYVLSRTLTGRRDAALVAAMAYACSPFRASHMAHLQWLMVGWLPLGLWALHRYFDTGRWRDLFRAAVCVLLQNLTATYFFYFSILPVAVVGAMEISRRRPPAARLLRHVLPICALMAIATAPVARAYYVVRRDAGLRRTASDIAAQSADVADYLHAAPRLRLWGGLGTAGPEHELFPGVVVLGLAVAAVISNRRSPAVRTYATIAVLAFVVSLGAAPTAWGHPLHVPGPYGWLLSVVPGLDGVRAVARLGLIVILALAVLAAFGAAWLLDRLPGGRRAAAAACCAVIVAEGWTAPIPAPAFAAMADSAELEAYEFLRQSPPGAVLELPASLDRFERESRYQYLTLLHGHPVVNGQSGYVTPLFGFFAGGQSPLNETTRLGDAISAVRAAGVGYLVVHHDAFDDRNVVRAWEDALVGERGQIASVRRFGDTTVAALLPLPTERVMVTDRAAIPGAAIRAQASGGLDRLPLLFDGDPDTRWLSGSAQRGDEWITLEFDRPRDVAAIRLRMAPRSNGDYPRVLAVESAGPAGSRTLFQGSVLPAFVRGLLTSGARPDIDLALPPNESAVLRLRQLGTARRFFWSIHELQVWQRSEQ